MSNGTSDSGSMSLDELAKPYPVWQKDLLKQYFPSGQIPSSLASTVYQALDAGAFQPGRGGGGNLAPEQINARSILDLAGQQAAAAAGGGGGPPAAPGQDGSTTSPYGPGGPDAPLRNLGAAMLTGVGLGAYGGYPVYNPVPGTGKTTIGGIQQPGQATYGTLQQPGNWNQIAQQAGLSPNDISEYQKAGMTPNQVAARFGLPAPPQAPPGVFGGAAPRPQPTVTAAAPAVRPIMPATAAQPTQISIPGATISSQQPGAGGFGAIAPPNFFQAPPAPGPATPAPYTGDVHEDPFVSRAVSAMMGFPFNPWHGPDGSPRGRSAGGTPTQKMAAGGVVAQRDTDTVPAMLSPGEFVVNRNAVQNVGVGTLNKINHMAGGGYVTGNQDDNTPPREVPRPMPATSDNVTSTKPSTDATTAQRNAQTTLNNLATNLPGSHPALGDLATMASQRFQAQQATAQAGGAAPGLGRAAQMAWGTGTNPNAGLPAGTSGYLSPSGQPVGATPGTTGISPTAGLASGVGAIGGAIADAANKWAQSVGPWRLQTSAIPSPDDFRNRYQPTFQAPGT